MILKKQQEMQRFNLISSKISRIKKIKQEILNYTERQDNIRKVGIILK